MNPVAIELQDFRMSGRQAWPLWVMILIGLNLGIDPKTWADLASAAMGLAEILLSLLGA